MIRICPDLVPCQNENPLQNLSSEDPDPLLFFGISFGEITGTLDCISQARIPVMCDSAFSQELADICARNKSVEERIASCNGATIVGCQPPGSCGGGDAGATILIDGTPIPDDPGVDTGPFPPGPPFQRPIRPWPPDRPIPPGHPHIPQRPRRFVFYNVEQTCETHCPDGTIFSFTTPPGRFAASNQASADRIAYSYACRQAIESQICLGPIHIKRITAHGVVLQDNVRACCLAGLYQAVITGGGGSGLLNWDIVGGGFPPGMSEANSLNSKSFIISGVPTAPGNYAFTVMVNDAAGRTAVKSYSIPVLGITNSPGDATVGSPYNFQFQSAGGTGPYAYAMDGTLPSGLSMDSDGTIHGTPDIDEGSLFTVSVTDANGAKCSKQFTLSANRSDFCDDAFTKRFRIKNYVTGMFAECPSCVLFGGGNWNGTFTLKFPEACDTGVACFFRGAPGNLLLNGLSSTATATADISHCANGLFSADGNWHVVVACLNNLTQTQIIWHGTKPGGLGSVAGIYTRVSGCDSRASIEIEEYQP